MTSASAALDPKSAIAATYLNLLRVDVYLSLSKVEEVMKEMQWKEEKSSDLCELRMGVGSDSLLPTVDANVDGTAWECIELDSSWNRHVGPCHGSLTLGAGRLIPSKYFQPLMNLHGQHIQAQQRTNGQGTGPVTALSHKVGQSGES